MRLSNPFSLRAETGTIGAPSRKLPRRNSLISDWTNSNQSFSTRSILVRAMIPLDIPKSEQICRCSFVCGIMPSSAAITIMTKSIPAAPETIFLMNFSWPGTSTMPRVCPEGKLSEANPNSIVMPLSYSSFKRSVSMPVSALINVVFPWST